ncbi:hypothetical protein TNIN_109121 [Trichonephila inaurata madagascariensis]|uniref:Uncharacterized protein n=1 Tax=Trichonephila inaurata madagascariensis TaxID=2747483 RepID=A0A8X6MFM0_9ARAC|nr:hypothetical protein TNIN_109121 [Trichonephila inaurata madagascariensis]
MSGNHSHLLKQFEPQSDEETELKTCFLHIQQRDKKRHPLLEECLLGTGLEYAARLKYLLPRTQLQVHLITTAFNESGGLRDQLSMRLKDFGGDLKCGRE